LEQIAVVLVNGATNTEYGRVNLGGLLPAGGFAVVASPVLTVAAGALLFRYPTPDNNIQNGGQVSGPDGVALFDLATAAVLDAISYEGSITAVTINGVGTVSLVEGTTTSVEDSNSSEGSVVRIPNGQDSDDAAADWAFTTSPTPGSANSH
jgi:hypothetical protein